MKLPKCLTCLVIAIDILLIIPEHYDMDKC